MLTKTDAIAVGKAFLAAANKEKDSSSTAEENYVINGVLIRALENLWYDLLTDKVKEKFNYNKENFLNAVWGLPFEEKSSVNSY